MYPNQGSHDGFYTITFQKAMNFFPFQQSPTIGSHFHVPDLIHQFVEKSTQMNQETYKTKVWFSSIYSIKS